jgi:hypothetical protein
MSLIHVSLQRMLQEEEESDAKMGDTESQEEEGMRDDDDEDDDMTRTDAASASRQRDCDIYIFPVIGSLWTIGNSGVPFPFSSNQNEDNRSEFEGKKYPTYKVGGNQQVPPKIWETLLPAAAPAALVEQQQRQRQHHPPTTTTMINSLECLQGVLQRVADQGAFKFSHTQTHAHKHTHIHSLCRFFVFGFQSFSVTPRLFSHSIMIECLPVVCCCRAFPHRTVLQRHVGLCLPRVLRKQVLHVLSSFPRFDPRACRCS